MVKLENGKIVKEVKPVRGYVKMLREAWAKIDTGGKSGKTDRRAKWQNR